MDSRSPLTLAEQLAAAQAWWLEAGVDSDFADEPRNWVERPAPEPAGCVPDGPSPVGAGRPACGPGG